MDNLTHTLVGVMLSKAGLGRAAPRATATLVLAANAPDIDVAAAGWGALTYLEHHRAMTHSLAGIPLLALVVTGLVRLFRRPGPFPWARHYGLAVLAVATHPLLDLLNTYGVRLLAPFSDRWYSWDLVHIVDPWLWAGMFFCLGAALLARLISGEIGAAPGSGARWAAAGLAFVAVWCGTRALLHSRAVGMLEAHAYGFDGARSAPLRVAAFPKPASPFTWRGLVETEQFYQMMEVDTLAPLDPTRGEVYYKPEPTPVLEAAFATPTAREFARFARYRLTRVEGNTVVFTDFRFLRERKDAFVCTIELDDSLRVVREAFHF
jgi:inner membrane protein